jgi:hypothetical protein
VTKRKPSVYEFVKAKSDEHVASLRHRLRKTLLRGEHTIEEMQRCRGKRRRARRPVQHRPAPCRR